MYFIDANTLQYFYNLQQMAYTLQTKNNFFNFQQNVNQSSYINLDEKS